jgi:DHA1 family bicyclomycin/chloramphenicol resistance-like MFS transporter
VDPGNAAAGTPSVRRGAGRRLGVVWAAAQRWPYLLVITTGAVGFGALFAYITGSPFAFQEVHGLSPSEFAVVFAVDGLCLMACARWVRFSRALHQIACGAAFLVAGSALLVVAAGTDGLAAARRLCGHRSVVGCDRPSVTALALIRHPERAGAAAALLGALQFRGGRGDGLAGGAQSHHGDPVIIPRRMGRLHRNDKPCPAALLVAGPGTGEVPVPASEAYGGGACE